MLEVLFSVIGVVGNIVGRKVVEFSLINIHVLLPGSAFYFIVTFVMLNVITIVSGKQEGQRCIKVGVISQVTAAVLFFLVSLMPAQETKMQNAYMLVLGVNWLFVIANIVALGISQYLQIFLFIKFSDKLKKGKANYISLILSQVVDTAVFLSIAFGIGSKWLFSAIGRTNLLNMFTSQYVVKFLIVSICGVPLAPVFSKLNKED